MSLGRHGQVGVECGRRRCGQQPVVGEAVHNNDVAIRLPVVLVLWFAAGCNWAKIGCDKMGQRPQPFGLAHTFLERSKRLFAREKQAGTLPQDATRQGASSVGHHQNQAKKREIPPWQHRQARGKQKLKEKGRKRERKGSGLRPARATTDTENVSYSDRPNRLRTLQRKKRVRAGAMTTMNHPWKSSTSGRGPRRWSGPAGRWSRLPWAVERGPGRSGERQAASDWPCIVASFGYRVPASVGDSQQDLLEPVRLGCHEVPCSAPPCFVWLALDWRRPRSQQTRKEKKYREKE
jgi:hypothetical protein